MQGQRKPWLALAGVGSAGLLFGYLTQRDAAVSLHFLSVGQGECAVFRDGNNTVLIDVGPKNERFDAGDRLVNPALRRFGVRKLDLILLTHPDMDHIGGLAGILKRHSVGQIVIPWHFQGHPDLTGVLREASVRRDQIVWIRAGQQIRLQSSTIEIQVPEWNKTFPDNEGSLIVKIKGSRGGSAVLSGDAGSDTELAMLQVNDWGAQILKAGHHGSNNATSSAWLREVHPKWVVLSCGAANSYGHPAPETLSRIVQSGAKPLRTDITGTIGFVEGSTGFEPAP